MVPLSLIWFYGIRADFCILNESNKLAEKYERNEEKVMEEEKKQKPKRVKVGAKRMLCWNSSGISSGCMMMVMGFLSIYCTDTMGIPAALVGTLLAASKIFDGFTDLIAGYIVDNTNSRWGKGRPYELALLFGWICTVLLYSCPQGLSMTVKCIWLFSMYVLTNSVFYTLLKANGTPYLVRAFKTEDEIVSLSTIGNIMTFGGVLIFNVTFPIMMAKLATSAAGWRTLVLIFAVPLCAFGMLRFFFIKETVKVETSEKANERVKFSDMFEVLKSNRYVWILALSGFALNFVTSLGVQTYYFKYIVGDLSVMSFMAFSQVIALPFLLIFPSFVKKYSAKILVMLGFIVSAGAALLNFFAYDNVPLLILAAIIIGIGSMPTSSMQSILTIECADYNEWKGMRRLEGTIGSVRGFAGKIGSGLGAGATGILLGMSGYISQEGAVQPGSALMMVRMLYSLVPMGLYLLVALSMKFYDLDKKLPQIRRDIEVKRGNVTAE